MTFQLIYDFLIKYDEQINDITNISSSDVSSCGDNFKRNDELMSELNISNSDYFSDSEDDYFDDSNCGVLSYKIEQLLNVFLNNVSRKIPELNGVKTKYNRLKKDIILSVNTLTVKGLIELLNKVGNVYHPQRYVKRVNDVFNKYKDEMINNTKLKNSKFKGFENMKLRLEILEDSIYANNEIIHENVKEFMNKELKDNYVIKSLIQSNINESINNYNHKIIKQVNKSLDNYSTGFDKYIKDVKEELHKDINNVVNKSINEKYNSINIRDKVNEQLEHYKHDNSLFVEYLNNLDIETVIEGMLKRMNDQNINGLILNDKFKKDMINKVNSFTNNIVKQNDKVDDLINSKLIKEHHKKYMLNKTAIKQTYKLSTEQLNELIKEVINKDELPEKILLTRSEIVELFNKLH